MCCRLSILGAFVAASGPPEGESVAVAWAIFWVVAALLGLFFVVVVVIAFVRRQRRQTSAPEPTRPPGADPWAEAGRRARPFPARRDD